MNNFTESLQEQISKIDRLDEFQKKSKKVQYEQNDKPGRVCERGCPVKMKVCESSKERCVLVCPRCGYKTEFTSII